MQLDFEVQRCTRRCAATDRPLSPGEVCYSVLEMKGAEIFRKDFSGEGWNGPPESAFAWWKSNVPEPTAKKVKLAPNDVLLELFDQLSGQPDRQDMRYVLALLLVRRRVFRLDAPVDFSAGNGANRKGAEETMTVFCPKRDAIYEVPAVVPTNERIEEIQQELSELLIAEAE